MKHIFALLVLFSSISANASLITTQVSEENSMVTVDIFLNNANPEIEWLTFDLLYDPFDLAFIPFDEFALDYDTNSAHHFVTEEVFNVSQFDLVIDLFGALSFQVQFMPDWQSIIGTGSLLLGQVQFESFASGSNVTVDDASIFAEGANFSPISQDELQVSVPEPATLGLFSMVIGLLLLRKRFN